MNKGSGPRPSPARPAAARPTSRKLRVAQHTRQVGSRIIDASIIRFRPLFAFVIHSICLYSTPQHTSPPPSRHRRRAVPSRAEPCRAVPGRSGHAAKCGIRAGLRRPPPPPAPAPRGCLPAARPRPRCRRWSRPPRRCGTACRRHRRRRRPRRWWRRRRRRGLRHPVKIWGHGPD